MGSKGLGALAAVLTVGIVGCGGSSEPTRAEFVKNADATCKETRTAVTQFIAANSGDARASADAMSQFVLAIVSREEALVRRLEAIKPPASLKADYSAYLANRHSLNELQRKVVRLAEPTATGTIEAGSKAEAVNDKRTDLSHKAIRQAHALGFRSCGGG